MLRLTRILSLCVVVCMGIAAARGGEVGEPAKAKAVFDELYGAELAGVAATRDGRDDAALAEHLLEAARTVENQPELLAVLCRKACELGANHPEGFETALEAALLLEDEIPKCAASAREMVIPVHRQAYSAARRPDVKVEAGEALIDAILVVADAKAAAGQVDAALALLREASTVARVIRSEFAEEVAAAQTRLAALKRAAGRLTRLKVVVERDPANQAARKQLVEMLLVEFDNPVEAAKYVAELDDAELRRYVPAAAKETDAAPESACIEMGDWYQQVAAEAPNQAKPAMLSRAQGYYSRFLDLHETEDLERAKVTLALQKVEEQLEKLGGASARWARWVDLLRLVNTARDTRGAGDAWKVRPDGLEFQGAPYGGDHLRLPVSLNGGYELRIRFQFPEAPRVRYMNIHFPVGARQVILGVPWGLDLRGWFIGSLPPTEGGTDGDVQPGDGGVDKPATVLPKRPYLLTILVRHDRTKQESRVTLKVDGKDVFAWTGPYQMPEKTRDLIAPLEASMEAWVIFHEIKVRMISGRVRRLRAKERTWPDDPMVYITSAGRKYHRSGCPYLRQSKIPIKLSEAKARGYTPCRLCKPP